MTGPNSGNSTVSPYMTVPHCRTQRSFTNFVYLQQAVKGGAARSSIDGLARSGDNYKEAIECLKARYDRPRLIHKAHVKMILEAAPLKDGNGKELRTLHDTVQQHVRALKSMGYEPSAPFITSAMELKLDETTMFEWQTHSQKTTGVPHYQDLFKVLGPSCSSHRITCIRPKSEEVEQIGSAWQENARLHQCPY